AGRAEGGREIAGFDELRHGIDQLDCAEEVANDADADGERNDEDRFDREQPEAMFCKQVDRHSGEEQMDEGEVEYEFEPEADFEAQFHSIPCFSNLR